MESFIEEHQPDYWIHGHIHKPVRYHIGKTEVDAIQLDMLMSRIMGMRRN